MSKNKQTNKQTIKQKLKEEERRLVVKNLKNQTHYQIGLTNNIIQKI